MKFRSKPQSWAGSRHGVTLIECLVYIGALAVVFALGLAAFHRSLENNAALRRNAADISEALQAGELWRADLRTAVQPPRFDAASQTLHIVGKNSEIAYRFAEAQISRRVAADGEWKTVLSRVQQSAMTIDARPHVNAWRWELELKSHPTRRLIHPLFTFTAATAP